MNPQKSEANDLEFLSQIALFHRDEKVALPCDELCFLCRKTFLKVKQCRRAGKFYSAYVWADTYFKIYLLLSDFVSNKSIRYHMRTIAQKLLDFSQSKNPLEQKLYQKWRCILDGDFPHDMPELIDWNDDPKDYDYDPENETWYP